MKLEELRLSQIDQQFLKMFWCHNKREIPYMCNNYIVFYTPLSYQI